MNVSWVLANGFILDPTVDIDSLKEVGSFWGGWRTWRGNNTDNVICFEPSEAKGLINRAFQQNCNLYVTVSAFQFLGRPSNVQVFDGEFQHDLDNKDDIISMHLAASRSDVVLLLGFDFTEKSKLESTIAEHKAHNYRQLTKQVILSNPDVQWVLIDHPGELRSDLTQCTNLTLDTLSNAISLLTT